MAEGSSGAAMPEVDSPVTLPPVVRAAPQEVEALAELLAGQRLAVVTGAGMSTASGIPDYRGPDGVRRVQPMTIGDFRAGPEARRRYWARAFVGWERFTGAQPNAGHRALAALQAEGAAGGEVAGITGVITQNVDGLHQRAGSPDVLDLHGTLSRIVCLVCGAVEERSSLQARLGELNPHHRDVALRGGQVRPDGDVALDEEVVASFRTVDCLVCGADELKPDVVYFGENVPRERVDRAYAMVDGADGLLVLGSSLKVMSGYRFARHVHRAGGPVAVVTRGWHRAHREATLTVDAMVDETLLAVADRLGVAVEAG
ncbi:Sir2 family NAD-dependent protein deacetylase [Kytococcus sp. Marseille-QA3725]